MSTVTGGVGTTPEDVAVKKSRKRGSGGGEDTATKASWGTRGTLTVICLLWIIPALGLAVTSFRQADQANNSGWWTVLGSLNKLTLSNYKFAIQNGNMGEAFINSLAIALPATFIPVLIASFAAYAFTFMKFPGRDFLFLLIVSLLVIPNYVAFVPILKIYASIGLAGKFPAVWLAHIGFGMSLAIYILRNYMATLPKSVMESAEIDGASHFQTFWRLILPMSVPALASFAIMQFLWTWNDLLVALIFIGPGDNQPVTVALNSLLGEQGANISYVTAGGLFSMLLPIIVFLAMQRFFVRGMTAGAVKG